MRAFDTERFSEQLVKLPEIIFGLVLAQSLVSYRAILIDPVPSGDPSSHVVAIVALITVYITTVLRWYDWHHTMMDRPYDMSRFGGTEWARLASDMVIVVLYAYLLFSIAPFESDPTAIIWRHLLGYPLIFIVYLLSGVARRRAYGPLASNLRSIIAFLAILSGVVSEYWLLTRQGASLALNVVVLLAVLGLMLLYRRNRRAETRARRELRDEGPIVAIDIDGVLGDQIAGVIPMVERDYAITLTYEDVVDWRYDFGPSDIATEIGRALSEEGYIRDMPVHEGAQKMTAALIPRHRVLVTTARSASTRDLTEEWLHRNRLFHDVLLNTEEAAKSSSAASILVDDYVGNVVEFLENTSGYAVLVRRPWNRDDSALSSHKDAGRVVTVDSLSEVPSAIRQFATQLALRDPPAQSSTRRRERGHRARGPKNEATPGRMGADDEPE